MQRIVFLDRDTIADRITLRRPNFAHEWVEYPKSTPADVVARAKGASILIVNKVPLSAEAIAALPDLKLVAVSATGTDCVDKAAAKAAGIAVVNIRGYATTTVPEHVFALILALERAIVPYRDDVIAGEWQKAGQFCFFTHPIRDLAGRRLGIIGRGALGDKVGKLGRAFDMDVVFAGRKGKPCHDAALTPWDEVIATSDILSLHCPLGPETRGLISHAEFKAMQRRPLIVNTARGCLVDEEALVVALDEGRISGAAFDVTLPEPPPADSPLMRIASRRNVIVTPHVAWASDSAMQALADQLIENIELFVAGRPRNLVEA